ncbi:hypothetical protein [Vibrio sagamiensis]|uniref:Lysozyme inhibitor LprI N-terminal domain-containing protein n=1 Tax=Vibrio sagamiensis NBRC 104589 TaxID=1219064 RepID=A0A511QK38_9VIBR|nr:hypothetical protein [Vibrio sagamiensis]PNQ53615.1 hypothetical protein C1141_20330 [Vibrio agarivorans]GEM77684.1 hypothetical protein VSA01S_37960 [Vibrio sagamiensis NBRC 104589]
MKFLTAITTSMILLSPLSASAYDAQEQFQECVKYSYSDLYSFLVYHVDKCQDKTECTQLQRDLDNINQVWAPGDIIFSQIQLDYDIDASTIFLWGASVGLNEMNTRELIIRTVDKCGISF